MQAATPDKPRLLLVDDDPLTLKTLHLVLGKRGFEIIGLDSPYKAEEWIAKNGTHSLDCLLTDFRMPGKNGLELMEHVRHIDESLSVIMITAESDKELVMQAMREGACDLIEKPFQFDIISRIIRRGTDRTKNNRQMATRSAQLEVLAQLHDRLNRRARERSGSRQEDPWIVELETAVIPVHDTGGDFIHSIRASNERLFIMLGDVSGHDVIAGFLSSYFQGVVRGLLELGIDTDTITAKLNHLLLTEWNRREAGESPSPPTSMATAIFEINQQRGEWTLQLTGTPAPVLCNEDNHMRMIADLSPPLGWFEPLESKSRTEPLGSRGQLYIWSDGLQDEANRQGVSGVSLAAWIRRNQASRSSPELAQRRDDLSVIWLSWQKREESVRPAEPIFLETYEGDSAGNINGHEQLWRRSLALVLGTLDDTRLEEISLCIREALLNGLVHGCKGDAKKSAQLEMFLIEDRTLAVAVVDEGNGYDVDAVHSVEPAPAEGHISFGLSIIRAYATRWDVSLGGRRLQLDFSLEPSKSEQL